MSVRRGAGGWPCALLVLCGSLSAGRAEAAPPTIGSTLQPIIYGEDDRTEVYASPSEKLRDLARRSVLALIPADGKREGVLQRLW